MKPLEQALHSDLAKILAGFGVWAAGAAVLLVLLFVALHTLYVFGIKTSFYKKPPEHNWSRRFYPVAMLLVAGLLALMWLLNVWSHTPNY